jgi:hypothetical protein
MSLGLSLFRHRVAWPATQPPEWASQVERWYQLDPAAYVLADTYWTHREHLREPPRWLLLASPAASNFTDHQFALSAPSPAKFVHTLPNIRGCSLLQLMNWNGQVLCLQRDPDTVLFALGEAYRLAEAEGQSIWVASARLSGNEWAAEIYTVGKEGHWPVRPCPSDNHGPPTHDDEWFQWLEVSPERKFVADGYEIIKK